MAHPPNPEQDEGTVELNFVTEEDLGRVEARLRERGVRVVSPASDEGFGAHLHVAGPDGQLVKMNRLEPEPYTSFTSGRGRCGQSSRRRSRRFAAAVPGRRHQAWSSRA